MEVSHALPPQVAESLARGGIVLTANQRAARTLHRAFDLRQRSLGIACWEPPAILAWDSWLEYLWHRLLLQGDASDLLLSPTQEHTIWRAIIAADTATSSLRPVDALAQTAADAFRLLHDYRARNRLHASLSNSDTRSFDLWANEFDRRCVRSHYLTHAQLAEALRTAVPAGHLTLPIELLLVGFDSKLPTQTALLDAVKSAGTAIDEYAPPPSVPSSTLASAPDDRTELAACAQWLRAHLAERPNATIAVIVPSIEPQRAEIDRVFRNILAPELNDIAAPNNSGPYEFSLGVPLAHTPLVAAALDILRWSIDPLPLDRLCALLLSPYFATNDPESTEFLARAEFDAFVLRQQHLLRPEISLDDVYSLVAASKYAAALPILLNQLRTLRPLFSKRELTSGNRTYADWAASVHHLLEAAGWAQLSHLDSVEFQTRRKWETALDELATLDFDGTRVSFSGALAALERIATETLFAPESRHAPIQIMGPLESAGSSFDAVWFLRANDLDWPSTPAPNPLLPWLLQRELAMPGANPAHDTARARRITERIAASAPSVVFSYARQSTGEGRQRPSPALNTLALEPRAASSLAPAAPAANLIELQAFIDDAPIPPPPDQVLQGGAGILRSQAACGFRAFAENRLFSSALDTASLGLDPGERGSLVHAVLENFWAEVKTQATLKLMGPDQRDTQLNRSIDIAFAKDHARPAAGWPSACIDTERQRLLSLLIDWLKFEETHRPPFRVKAREERLSDVPIGPLRLDIRVDRVDVNLSDNEPAGEIILDYKTGSAAPAAWLGPRPDEPQLPLYAVVSNNPNLAAVAFASVRPGNLMGIAGYETRDSGVLPKPSRMSADSLAAQIDEWRDALNSLAHDFHSGNASVSPKHYPQTCEYCEQRLLCRLDLSALDADALEDPDDAEADAFSAAGEEEDLA